MSAYYYNRGAAQRKQLRAERKSKGLCPKCGQIADTKYSYCSTCRNASARLNRETYKNQRQDVLTKYGGSCVCCGESTPEFLSVDHINGGGTRHRKTLSSKFYRWLQINGYPQKEFQLLCHNCNLAKGFYGQCPHKTQKLLELARAGAQPSGE